jgi:hypothetical protein
MEFSRCAWTGVHEKTRPNGRSLKTQQRDAIPTAGFRRSRHSRSAEVDVIPGEPAGRTAEAIDGAGACRSWSSGIPRKEVIQPQLPLRLPCYDFTPIIDPTFDGCLLRRG